MVVIVIIAILAAVAIPMYGNYTIRAKIGSEIEKLGSAKAMASEYASNNDGSLGYAISDLGTLPSGATVGDNGELVLDTSSIVADSLVSLVPTVSSGTVLWSCTATGLSSSQMPSNCQSSAESSSNSSNDNNSSGSFDANLLETSDTQIMGQPCLDSTCYNYGDNQKIGIGNDGEISSYIFEGAGLGELYVDDNGDLKDGLVIGYNSSDVLNIGSFADQKEFTSMSDFENSEDLTDEQKQQARVTIDAVKETGYCNDHPTAIFC